MALPVSPILFKMITVKEMKKKKKSDTGMRTEVLSVDG
jgi:hypothetical protein